MPCVSSGAFLISSLPFHQSPTTLTNSALGSKSSSNACMSCRFQQSAKARTTCVTSVIGSDIAVSSAKGKLMPL